MTSKNDNVRGRARMFLQEVVHTDKVNHSVFANLRWLPQLISNGFNDDIEMKLCDHT